MGYTHYWERTEGPSDRQSFCELGTDAKRIIAVAEQQGISIRDAFGEGEPEFTELRFALNGDASKSDEFYGDQAHETFSWTSEPVDFAFCKTAYKPYDAVVTAILIRAKHIYGEAVSISSDGDWDEWTSGRELYRQVFGTLAPCPFSYEEVES